MRQSETALEFSAELMKQAEVPLAGDVYAAAVILNPDNYIEGLNDSKKLSEKKREKLMMRLLKRQKITVLQERLLQK